MTYLVFLFCFLPPQSVGRQWSLSNELLRATKGARKLFLVSNISLTVQRGFCRIFSHSIVATKSFFFFKTQTVNPLRVWQLLRLSLREGLNGGTSITLNTSLFWLCNMKQLNFRHFNTNGKKFFETLNFFQEEDAKNGSKKANIVLFSISTSFRPFYDKSGLFQKISEGHRRFPKTAEDFRRLTGIEEVRTLRTFNSISF